MSKPIRIQRRRTKGWRMPPNTVYVGRGSKWGNPQRVHEYCTAAEACPLNQPCHADVLLELANR